METNIFVILFYKCLLAVIEIVNQTNLDLFNHVKTEAFQVLSQTWYYENKRITLNAT